MLHAISTGILALLITGVFLRRNRAWHPKIMFTAFVLDVLLVLYIEFTLQAIERVVSETGLLLWFHAGVSTTVILLYIAMIVLGRRLLRGDNTIRTLHRNLGIALLVLRSINYVTSYMV